MIRAAYNRHKWYLTSLPQTTRLNMPFMMRRVLLSSLLMLLLRSGCGWLYLLMTVWLSMCPGSAGDRIVEENGASTLRLLTQDACPFGGRGPNSYFDTSIQRVRASPFPPPPPSPHPPNISSRYASISSHSLGVRLRTRYVRLPIPSMQQLGGPVCRLGNCLAFEVGSPKKSRCHLGGDPQKGSRPRERTWFSARRRT